MAEWLMTKEAPMISAVSENGLMAASLMAGTGNGRTGTLCTATNFVTLQLSVQDKIHIWVFFLGR
jgi:hypothetical protein